MPNLRDVIVYICQHYPREQELTETRLTQIVYLADWLHAVQHGVPFLDIAWEFNIYYGLSTDPIANVVAEDEVFELAEISDVFGYPKRVVRLKEEVSQVPLPETEMRVIDAVIQTASSGTFDSFIRYLYHTFALASETGASKLNLNDLARRYKAGQGEESSKQKLRSGGKGNFAPMTS